MKIEIGKKLKTAQIDLQGMGVERETPESQSAFLLSLATRFQKVVSLGLYAKYGSSDLFDDDPSLRLATEVISRNLQFATEVEDWGQEVSIQFSG